MTGWGSECVRKLAQEYERRRDKEVAANEHGRSPSIDFSLEPWVNPKQVQKDAREEPEADSIDASNAKDGGFLYVYGRSRLDDATGRCFVEFGIGQEVRSGDKNLHPITYARLSGGAFRKVKHL